MSDPEVISVEFLKLFGRFEFALKRAGILKDRRDALADWTTYSSMLGQPFFEEVVNLDIAPRLIAHPPRKLLRVGLEWSLPLPAPIDDVTALFVLGVCRVRNNYVHGEKFRNRRDADWSRDTALITDALAVLTAAVGRVPEVDIHL